MFSSGSESSISFATVTPSFVTVGAPNFLSITTFRPLGPRVTFTASASWSTPRFRAARASMLKWSSLAAIAVSCEFVVLWSGAGSQVWGVGTHHLSPVTNHLANDREDVGLAEDEVV